MEWAGDNESSGIAEAGGNFRVLPTQRPKVLPRLPRRNSGVHDRTPGDVQPSLHVGGDQVVANFFSCVHLGSKFWGAASEPSFSRIVSKSRDAPAESKRLSVRIVQNSLL